MIKLLPTMVFTEGRWENIGSRTLAILPVSSSLPEGQKRVRVLQKDTDGSWVGCTIVDREVVPADSDTTEDWVRDYYTRGG